MPRWLYVLLIFALLAPLLNLFLHVPPLLLFVFAGLGILPLAALIGQSVEHIAEHTGERIGGLLFATFGNATELIIGIFALSAGLVDVVRASIIGSILGNLMLVLGISICVGSLKHGRLRFETRVASQYASLLALCIGGLILPTIAELLASRSHQSQIFERGVFLSDVLAVMLLIGYIASILFSVFHVGDKGTEQEEAEELDPVLGARSIKAIGRLLAYRRNVAQSTKPGKSGVLRQIDSTVEAIVAHESETMPPSLPGQDQKPADLPWGHSGPGSTASAPVPATPSPARKDGGKSVEQKAPLVPALILLAVATAGVAVLSEILVGTIEPLTRTLNLNPAFVGLIFLPLIGGLPEYFNTISMALDKRMGMVLAASAGSSIQIALLVAPLLVLVSMFMPKRFDLVFSIIEIAVLGLATFLYSEITRDGELVWLEGLLLILLYAMMGATVFLFGA
jgi:Ca2+:H+ antiporter